MLAVAESDIPCCNGGALPGTGAVITPAGPPGTAETRTQLPGRPAALLTKPAPDRGSCARPGPAIHRALEHAPAARASHTIDMSGPLAAVAPDLWSRTGPGGCGLR